MLQRQWQESRTRLGAHLQLYQLHSAAHLERLAEAPEAYWARRSTLPWN